MQKKSCEHCGHELDEFDKYGNEGWNCPNDCAFEKGCEEDRKTFVPDDDDISDNQNGLSNPQPIMAHVEVKKSHCWNCKGVVVRLPQCQDSPYGHICPSCRHSLRDNPIFGEGGPCDRALNSY